MMNNAFPLAALALPISAMPGTWAQTSPNHTMHCPVSRETRSVDYAIDPGLRAATGVRFDNGTVVVE